MSEQSVPEDSRFEALVEFWTGYDGLEEEEVREDLQRARQSWGDRKIVEYGKKGQGRNSAVAVWTFSQPPKPSDRSAIEAKIRELDILAWQWQVSEESVELQRRHYGPGPHPGTGTEQEVHAGGRGGSGNKKTARGRKQIFHGTGARAVKSIMRSGLQISHADSNNIESGVVFAAPDYESAQFFAARRSVNYAVVTIDPSLAGSKPRPGFIGGELMFGRDIPADAIVKVDIYRRGERRADDRLVQSIERTRAKPMLFVGVSIGDDDEFVLVGPTKADQLADRPLPIELVFVASPQLGETPKVYLNSVEKINTLLKELNLRFTLKEERTKAIVSDFYGRMSDE